MPRRTDRLSGLTDSGANAATHRRWQAGVLLAWAAVVLLLVARHVFWRDEVRALSLALQGDNVLAMLRGLHGEGHPAVWYLLLRGAHALHAAPQVLPAVAFGVALAAAALLAFRSPLGWPVVALFLFGRAGLYEYAVMARNYGIAMLLMFAFAALYPRGRERGLWLGAVLLLLANCNVHAMLLAFAFLCFWLLDLIAQPPDSKALRRAAWRNFGVNLLLVLVGAALCVATIYPPFNDAAQAGQSTGLSLSHLVRAAVLPAASFEQLAGYELWRAVLPSPRWWQWPGTLLLHAAMSALLFGSTLALVRRPAAMGVALAALVGLSVFFSVIYVGGYRHQALWLVFLVSLCWIAGQPAAAQSAAPRVPAWLRPPAGVPTRWQATLGRLGSGSLGVLLALQVAAGALHVWPMATGQAPESRSRDLAALLATYPELQQAVLIADPDYLLEALPYYLPNPSYLLRERREGPIVRFTRNARLSLDLAEMLAEARRLRERSGRPVVMLLKERLDPTLPAHTTREGYNWQFSETPAQVQDFLAATQRLQRFAPACCSDESFDVYRLLP